MASVRKRGNSYQLRVYAGSESSGEQVIKTKTWKPPDSMTEKQAEKEAQKQAFLFEQECQQGISVSSNIKFSDFADQWFEQYAVINLRPTSYERMLLLKKRVYNAFGYMRIDKINAWTVQSFMRDLINQREKRKNRKTVIAENRSTLSQFYFYCDELCGKNGYSERQSLPKGFASAKRRRRKRNLFN